MTISRRQLLHAAPAVALLPFFPAQGKGQTKKTTTTTTQSETTATTELVTTTTNSPVTGTEPDLRVFASIGELGAAAGQFGEMATINYQSWWIWTRSYSGEGHWVQFA